MHLSVTPGIGLGLAQMMSLAQIPTIGSEREGQQPWNADEVFRFGITTPDLDVAA